MENLTSEVKKIALMNEMDYVGVTPVERLTNAPEGFKPTDLLPSAKSAVSLGVKLSRGVAEANRRAYTGFRHGIYTYLMHGYVLLNRNLDENALRLTRFLENHGYTALPVPASRPFDPLALKGAVSHRHVAVAAGLGEFGWNTLLVTPDSGPRVRLTTVLTEADLEPDPMYSGKRICDRKRCGLVCVKICPVKAFSAREAEKLEIGGRLFEYSKLDHWKCLFGAAGFSEKTLGRKNLEVSENPTPSDYLKALELVSPWQKIERAEEGSFCGRCVIHCPIGTKRN